jgi:hypothetical protein
MCAALFLAHNHVKVLTYLNHLQFMLAAWTVKECGSLTCKCNGYLLASFTSSYLTSQIDFMHEFPSQWHPYHRGVALTSVRMDLVH